MDTVPAGMMVLDYLHGRGDVDTDRIVVAGGSFGALISPALAAADERITAVAILFGAGDLQQVIEENLKSRQEAAEQAEDIIDVQVEHFMSWLRSLDAVPAIRAYREHARTLGELEVRKARQRLANGESPEAVLETLARNLVNKLAHAPSVNLREAADHGRTGLLETVRTLFNLKPGQ